MVSFGQDIESYVLADPLSSYNDMLGWERRLPEEWKTKKRVIPATTDQMY